mmetsp:Transcript_8841/g.20782  ORF Transcript_8841/g.20782 Transcript_8841/m.20782 type:complete len:337 (-) Transcript_8841:35-1045(-)
MHTSRMRTRPRGGGLLVASTKRKSTVTCAAANDDEDLGRLFEAKVGRTKENEAEGKKACAELPDEAEKGSGKRGSARRRKKEFAWMDSDEGEESSGDKLGAEERSEGACEDHGSCDEEELEVSAEVLDQVQSFGRMMLLAPCLQKWLQGGRRSPGDVVAACRALARTKFFDAEIIEDIYSVLRKLDMVQTNDAILCLKTLNAYDKGVFSAVAKAFKGKTGSMEQTMRNVWLEIFKGFGHDLEKDFIQLLEVPPVPPTMPGYRKVRCWHHSRGLCVLDSACTFSHDSRAPLSLGEGGREDWWRSKSVMMTQNQKTLGDGAYGLGPLGRGGPLSPYGQ